MAQAASPVEINLNHSNIAPPSAAAAPDAAETRTSVAFQRFCSACTKSNPDAKLCSGCKAVRFCDKACAKAGWAAHKALCKQPTIRDQLGLTPLHHAILAGNKKMLEPEFLEKHSHVRDSFNGTMEDLENLMRPIPPDDETDTGWEFRDNDGVIKPLTRKKFHEITDMHFLDGLQGTADTIKNLHVLPDSESHISSDDPKVQAFNPQKAPKTYMQKDPKMGWGVFAKEFIKDGNLVCFAGGRLVKEWETTPKRTRYNLVETIDSVEVAGKGIIFNDGPPNCRIRLIKNYKGVPIVPVMEAIRDIKPGEELLISYNETDDRELEGFVAAKPHAIKLGYYGLTGESTRELQRFCEEEYAQVLDSVMKAGPITQHQKSLLYYFLDTTQAFIKMHLIKSAKTDITRKALPILQPRIRISTSIRYLDILKSIDKIHQLENQGDKTLVEEVLKLGDRHPAFIFALMMNLMAFDDTLSNRSIPHYQTLGEMLKILLNHSDAESRKYEKMKSPEEKEVEGLKIPSFEKQFGSLTPFLQKVFLKYLSLCLDLAKDHPKELQVLEQLQKKLQK